MYCKMLFVTAIIYVVSAPACVEAQAVDGNWTLTYLSGYGTTEQSDLVVSLKTVDGKITGKVIGWRTTGEKNSSVGQFGESLRIQGPARNDDFAMEFQAPIPKTAPKRWLGAYTRGKRTYPAWLSPTAEGGVTQFGSIPEASRTHVCPPLQEAAQIKKNLDKKPPRTGVKSSQNAKERRALEKQKSEIDEIFKKQSAVHYRQALEKFPNDPAIFVAVHALLRSAQVNQATLEDVKSWSAAADKLGKDYGPFFEAGFAADAVEALDGQDAYAKVAIEYARRVERALTPKAPLQEQIYALRPLARALRSGGKADDARAVEAKIEHMEGQLDRDYLASLPEVTPFAGRKSKSERVVLLEQFTHGTFGPAEIDRSCSLLLKAYKPGELAMVQYPTYGHFSGADGAVLNRGPLSCAEANARYGYFRKAFPVEMKSWSATLLNGHPKARIGSNQDTEKTFQAFHQVIDPLLEEDAGAELTGKATRAGAKIDIQINVKLKQADEGKKLRIVLVEQSIRYPNPRYIGKDGARLHHHIARAFPGGVAGKSLTEAVSKHSVTVDIEELRKNLTDHLKDAFDSRGWLLSVPPPASLLKLDNLRVIAFVQDDNTRDVLQAVQMDVASK